MGYKTLGVPSCLGLNYENLEIATSGGYDEPTLWEPKVGYPGPHLGKQTKDYYVFGHFSCQLIPAGCSIFESLPQVDTLSDPTDKVATLS